MYLVSCEYSNRAREIEIKKGIRQECILSPIFFNLYSEDIINRALSEQNTGIKANGISINKDKLTTRL